MQLIGSFRIIVMILKYLLLLLLLLIIILILFNLRKSKSECCFIGATASSDNHAIYWSNVIYSFAIHNPNCKLFCYNLNLNDYNFYKIKLDVYLTNKYIGKTKSKGKVYFLNYTQNIYTKEFAVTSMSFKPTIIYRLLNKYHTTVIWMDAGVEILKPLLEEVKLAEKHGFYMDRNRHILLDWAHPSAINFLNYSREMFLNLHDTDSGYLTINYNIDFLEKIINRWYECAKHRECISPLNFTRKYYRRDQPALSMLIYRTLPYSKYVGKEEIKNSHLKQCDHKKGCNIKSNYIKIINSIK